MSREKQEITTWRYPYTAIEGIKNMGKYGTGPALFHDWERTKENMESRLEKAAFGVISGIAICVAIPLGIYQLYKVNRAFNKREKQRKRMAADEGFYPEIHENKDIKRY